MPIDHLDLVVRDLDRSVAFYRGLLAPVGYPREKPIVGEHVLYFGHESGSGAGAIGLRQTRSANPPTGYDRYAVGAHHVVFAASSREIVDERAAWLREVGATIESGPKEYDYTPGYYAVFFYDPDGIKLEIVHRPR